MGEVSMVINGRIVTIPVMRVQYQNRDRGSRAGGVTEDRDGSIQIMLDARLSDSDSQEMLEKAMAQVSERLLIRGMN